MVAFQKMSKTNHLLIQLGHIEPMSWSVNGTFKIFGFVRSFQKSPTIFRVNGVVVSVGPGHARDMHDLGQISIGSKSNEVFLLFCQWSIHKTFLSLQKVPSIKLL